MVCIPDSRVRIAYIECNLPFKDFEKSKKENERYDSIKLKAEFQLCFFLAKNEKNI